MNAIIDLDSPQEELGDGYRVEARIKTWEGKDVLRVPASAVFRHENGRAVFVAIDGVVERRAIEIGRSDGLLVEVRGGLEGGEIVVAYPSDAIGPGIKVVPR